jgi:hypothetical protein
MSGQSWWKKSNDKYLRMDGVDGSDKWAAVNAGALWTDKHKSFPLKRKSVCAALKRG